MGGHLDFMCDQTLNFLQPSMSGLIKAYAATTQQRLKVAPDLPTIAESGLPDFQMVVWYAMYALKGTPAVVVEKLSAALQKSLDDPDVKDRLARSGAETVAPERARPDVLRAHLKSEIDKWVPIPGKRACRPNKLAGPGGFSAEPPYAYQTACKPGSVWPTARAADVTAIPLARRLPGASSNLPERLIRTDPGLLPRRSYSVLLPVGFAVPLPSPEVRCALTAPFHPCRG